MTSTRHNSTGILESTSILTDNQLWETANCQFLEAALLERKASAEIEKRRQFMRQCVLDVVDSEDKLSRRVAKLEGDLSELNMKCNLEEILDNQLVVLRGPVSSPELRKSVRDLYRAASTSLSCMKVTKMCMPESETDQGLLESELKDVCALFDELDTKTDSVNVARSSTSAKLVDSCLQREVESITKLRTLVADVKHLTEEKSLLAACEGVARRATLN